MMKKIFISFIIVYLTLVVSAGAIAELYQWADKEGVITISDYPPQNKEGKGKVQSLSTTKGSSQPENSINTQSRYTKSIRDANTDREIKQTKIPQVEIFTTSWCSYCRQARHFLQSRSISFTEYDIEKDKSAALRRKEMDNRGGVPFAIINGQRILGFSEAAYLKALKEIP
jgi:glutaredoxin